MKKTIRLIMIIGVSASCQLLSLGTPWAPKPYPQLEPISIKPQPPIAVPEGCDKLLSRGCAVTSSTPDPLIGELFYVTDGVKEHDASTYVELDRGLQWIQIDLGGECEIHAVCIWHYADLRAYHDVICQISNDPEFKDGVIIVFNNDHDNSAGFGIGKEMDYVETCFGRPFAVDAVKGRYVRCYSNGSTHSNSTGSGNGTTLINCYTEIEVFGKPLKEPQKTEGSKTSPMSEANTKLYDSLPEPPQGKVWLKIEYPRGIFRTE